MAEYQLPPWTYSGERIRRVTSPSRVQRVESSLLTSSLTRITRPPAPRGALKPPRLSPPAPGRGSQRARRRGRGGRFSTPVRILQPRPGARRAPRVRRGDHVVHRASRSSITPRSDSLHLQKLGARSGVPPCGERERRSGAPRGYIHTAHSLRGKLPKAPGRGKWPERCSQSEGNLSEPRYGEVRMQRLPRTPVNKGIRKGTSFSSRPLLS